MAAMIFPSSGHREELHEQMEAKRKDQITIKRYDYEYMGKDTQIGQKPVPTTSSQSPLRVYRPAGEGIPRSAPLLLSSKQNPLRWAFVW